MGNPALKERSPEIVTTEPPESVELPALEVKERPSVGSKILDFIRNLGSRWAASAPTEAKPKEHTRPRFFAD